MNAVIRPVLVILTLPITIITLGLFLLVINALMMLLAAEFAPGFEVDTFGAALVGGLLLALFNLAASVRAARQQEVLRNADAVAVFGTGGVGAYFGARLAEAGNDVAFIARGAHLDAIRANGLRVDSVLGDMLVRPALASDSAEDVGAVDVVLLGVKTWQVADVAPALKPLLGPETLIVPLQNGVETADAARGASSARSHVAGGVCGGFCFIVGPGHVKHLGGVTFIKFGELDGTKSARVERLRAEFVKAKVDAAVPDDIRVALWEKLMLVVPFGGIGAVSRAPIGVITKTPETRALLVAGMQEIAAVARAQGVRLPPETLERTLALLDGTTPAAHLLAAARHRGRQALGARRVDGRRRAARRRARRADAAALLHIRGAAAARAARARRDRVLSAPAARSVQIGRLQVGRVPRLVANVRARLDAPAFGRADVDVLVAAVPIDAAGAAHPELHEIDPPFRALGRRGDLVIQHQVAPVGPDELRLAALRAAADELRERVAALREHAAAGGVARVGVLVDELPVGREHVRVVVAVAAARVDAVRVAVDELRDLLVVERRQRAALGRDGRAAPQIPHRCRRGPRRTRAADERRDADDRNESCST